MADVGKSIAKYIESVIALSRTDISSAVASREWLLRRVQNEIANRKDGPALYADQPILYYGSYFKRTQVADIDEFDVMLVIDSNTGVMSVGGLGIGDGLGGVCPNPKYSARFFKEDGSGVSPSKILNWTKDVITSVVERHGGEAPERDGQAITAIIASQGLKIDFVPGGAFKRKADGKIFYNIPKGDRDGSWILTAPQDDIQRLEIAAKNRNEFRNVIRIAKRIKNKYNFLVSSFAIETAIVNYTTVATWYNKIYEDTVLTLTYLAGTFRGGSVLDAFDGTTNLLGSVEQLNWYAERIEGIIATLKQCTTESDQEWADEKVRRAFENE